MTDQKQMDMLNEAIKQHLKQYPQVVSHPSIKIDGAVVPKVQQEAVVELEASIQETIIEEEENEAE